MCAERRGWVAGITSPHVSHCSARLAVCSHWFVRTAGRPCGDRAGDRCRGVARNVASGGAMHGRVRWLAGKGWSTRTGRRPRCGGRWRPSRPAWTSCGKRRAGRSVKSRGCAVGWRGWSAASGRPTRSEGQELLSWEARLGGLLEQARGAVGGQLDP